MLERGAVSVCTQHPGFEVDLVVTMATADLADVFQGYRRWHGCGGLRSDLGDGPAAPGRGPARRWFLWSPWVDVTHARAHRPVIA